MPEDFALKMWDSRTELELAYTAITRGNLDEERPPLAPPYEGGEKKMRSREGRDSAN